MTHLLDRRRAGVLCAVSSLPAGSHEAFLDFLAAAGIAVWQVLPLNPPDAHGSPYSSASLFAMDPALGQLVDRPVAPPVGLDSAGVADYARFIVARARFGAPWTAWPEGLRAGEPAALADFEATTGDARERIVAAQRQASAAWATLKRAANARGILIMGDMPLYPAHDSADVWAHPELFDLDDAGEPNEVAGVPPDYFSATGQLWGNPLYDWAAHRDQGFGWWRRRVNHQLARFDLLRIDHFRGLEAYWAVPRGGRADAGRWRPAPGRALLGALEPGQRRRLVAEDLGFVTPAVEALRDGFSLPGMRVLQFAFDGRTDNPHLPDHCPAHAVMYTGTHDNDTGLGWYRALDAATRHRVERLIGGTGASWPWPLIEAALQSPARTAVVPLQDLLGLDGRHRLNTPGTATGNWGWQADPASLTPTLARRIRCRLAASDRLQDDAGQGR